MDKPIHFAAALIAGGRSRRLGQDKAFLPWPELPLWRMQLAKLAALQPAELLLAGRADQPWDDLGGVTFQPDPLDEDAGPLKSVIRCLEHAEAPLVVLAVDMPAMEAEFLKQQLLRRLQLGRSLVFTRAGQLEPMASLLLPDLLPLLCAEAEAAGSLQKALRRGIEAGLCQTLPISEADAGLFLNINEPADLQQHQPQRPFRSEVRVQLHRIQRAGGGQECEDVAAVEEPLEIRVEGRSVAVVMRTPGHDRELAAGFLVSEGIVRSARDILEVSQCPAVGDSKGNVVDVLLGGVVVEWDKLTRHVFSASSCGLCGKTSLDSVFVRFPSVSEQKPVIAPDLLWKLPDRLREAQHTFSRTGGLHACAIFDLEGNTIVLREDVGRHNALDKVLGYGLMEGLLPWSQHILVLSGRVSFEMMQKALAAGVPIVAALSAPSSLAIDFAEDSGQTLIGFLREKSLNVYTGGQRLLQTT
jgi:FdhD protein